MSMKLNSYIYVMIVIPWRESLFIGLQNFDVLSIFFFQMCMCCEKCEVTKKQNSWYIIVPTPEVIVMNDVNFLCEEFVVASVLNNNWIISCPYSNGMFNLIYPVGVVVWWICAYTSRLRMCILFLVAYVWYLDTAA